MVYTVSLSGMCACIKYTTLSLLYAGVGMSSDSGKYATRVTYVQLHPCTGSYRECRHAATLGLSAYVCVPFYELESRRHTL